MKAIFDLRRYSLICVKFSIRFGIVQKKTLYDFVNDSLFIQFKVDLETRHTLVMFVLSTLKRFLFMKCINDWRHMQNNPFLWLKKWNIKKNQKSVYRIEFAQLQNS